MRMGNDNQIRLMLVDDHPLLRDGMKVMLETWKKFTVAAVCPNGNEALRWLDANGRVDLIISDVRMPKMDGFAFLKAIRHAYSGIPVLMLAGMPLKAEEQKARELGASGYFSKSAPIEEVIEAIDAILADKTYFAVDGGKKSPDILSKREAEVLKLVADGLQREQIAAKLFISPETVKSRLRNVMLKLDVTNSPSAVKRAYELGIL